MSHSRKRPQKAEGPVKTDAQPRGPTRRTRLGRSLDRTVAILGEIESGQTAERAVKRIFAQARDLGPHERRTIKETVYGILRTRRALLDRLARAAEGGRVRFEHLEPPMIQRLLVLAYLAEGGTPATELEAFDRYAYRRLPGVWTRLLGGKLKKVRRSPEETLGVETSLPDWAVSRLCRHLGFDQAKRIGEALCGRAPVTLRVNRLRASREEAQTRMATEHGVDAQTTPLSPDGLTLAPGTHLVEWPMFKEGWIELQDEASQLAALATGAKPGEEVLDGCGGAGGKALTIAAMTGDQARIVSLDVDGKKGSRLRSRMKRAGVQHFRVLTGDLLALPPHARGAFDCVLLDAPCSGSGVWRRHPEGRWRMGDDDIDRFSEAQSRLLTGAATALKPGGRLIYVTCSVFWEENEQVIERFLEQSPLKPLPLRFAWDPKICETLDATYQARIGPQGESGPDGFYVATMTAPPA